MDIVPSQDGILRIEHVILEIRERQIPVYIRHRSHPDKERIRIRCSFCGRVHHRGRWEEPCLEHIDASSEIRVVYAVCEDCQCSLPRSC